jgi:LysR family nitrogen assimilation transcriptional regulator
MELRQLRYFVMVAELKSFSRAAANAHIAQPALSRQVRKLEEELGASLLVRDGRGATLSSVGEQFYLRVKEVLNRLQQAKADVQSLHNVPTGEITLGVAQQLGPAFIASIARKFRHAYPQASLRIIEGFSFQIEEWLDLGRVEVGVFYDPSSMKDLVGKVIFTENLYLVGAANSFIAAEEECEFSEIEGLPLILPDRPSCLRDRIDNEAAKRGIKTNVFIEVDSIGAIKELIRDGQGYSIMSYSSCDQELKRGELAAARIVRPSLIRPLVVALSPKSVKSVTTRTLMELVSSEVGRFVEENRLRGSAGSLSSVPQIGAKSHLAVSKESIAVRSI